MILSQNNFGFSTFNDEDFVFKSKYNIYSDVKSVCPPPDFLFCMFVTLQCFKTYLDISQGQHKLIQKIVFELRCLLLRDKKSKASLLGTV